MDEYKITKQQAHLFATSIYSEVKKHLTEPSTTPAQQPNPSGDCQMTA